MKVHEHSGNVSLLRPLVLAATVLAGVAASGAARADSKAPFGPWQAELLRNHPLVGTIADAKTLAPMSRGQVEERLGKAGIAILGEVHDNPDHHRIQALLLRAFARGRDKPPKVVFEMIPADKEGALSALKGARKLSANAVFDLVDWDNSGWPARAIYAPVMRATVEVSGLPVPAGLPREMVRKVSKQGLAALSRMQIGQYRLGPLPPKMQKALEKDIIKSHCDMIPPAAAQAMAPVQRLRDALLAARLADAWQKAGSAVLITGNGHARKDRGVPYYLKRQKTPFMGTKARGIPDPLVVWLAEANDKAATIRDLLPKDAAPAELADIIIVTPRAAREDPCERFRKFMRHKSKSGKMDGKN